MNFQYRYAYTSMMKMHLDKIEKVEQVSQKKQMLFSVHFFPEISFFQNGGLPGFSLYDIIAKKSVFWTSFEHLYKV